jgi:hypothetical protein
MATGPTYYDKDNGLKSERLERICIVAAALGLRSPSVLLIVVLHSSFLTRPTTRAAMLEYAICFLIVSFVVT